ncbi:hypothetical protein B0H13DRAFT_2317062 [Mycena leptocephala]|nr:hypothetical protein B0H13DRAFT_2317062 [Mycena leptocephala]
MFNRSGPPTNTLSLSPSFNPTQTSKKRKRQSSESSDFPPLASAGDHGKPRVPRRIDPDRLAIRLGPELASEMDAFIVPGAKMPSFEQLVTKYNVDRRHIYDYFHSRGLRVAKEDKYLNLSHRMSKKAKPAFSRKPAASKVVPPGDVNPVESATPSPETNSVPSPITTPVSPPRPRYQFLFPPI